MATLEDQYYAEAERLYVREGRTLAQIAEETGGETSISTLSRWSQKGGWPEQRQRWREVKTDLPIRLLNVVRRRVGWLEEHPEEARGDDLTKLKGLLEYLADEMSGGEEGAAVDRLAVWLELMQGLIEDLKEFEPEGVNLIHRHYDELVKRARKRYA